MASPDLRPLPRLQLGELASRMPAPLPGLRMHVVEPLRVLSLRCLPGESAAISAAAGVDLPGPGRFHGVDPLLVWRSPSEWLHVGTRDEPADALLRALPVGGGAQATDLSAGVLVVEVNGSRIDALLQRLVDASVQLQLPGQGTRARLADIAVVAMRLAEERLWLLVDRAHDHYLADWLAYAGVAVALSTSEA